MNFSYSKSYSIPEFFITSESIFFQLEENSLADMDDDDLYGLLEGKALLGVVVVGVFCNAFLLSTVSNNELNLIRNFRKLLQVKNRCINTVNESVLQDDISFLNVHVESFRLKALEKL